MIVSLMINENPVLVEVESNTTLLQLLREQLGLTGSKYGCGTNDCGACKVLINGDAKNACVLLVKNLEGQSVYTIEFFSKEDTLHPVQEAFIEVGAIQCGYCTPGMVITAIALLRRNKEPSRLDIIYALEGNLCRCTGYEKIVEAIMLASQKMEVRATCVR